MTEFSLDTSGAVQAPSIAVPGILSWWVWSDLDQFEQGYGRAAILAIRCPDPSEGYGPSSSVIRFDWLTPEALVTILKDCANARATLGYADTQEAGETFYMHRACGALSGDFPPQTIYLDENGKVRFR